MQPVSAGDDLLGERQGVHATLVDAAARAVARHAMDGATVERIAEEAGLSRVTLHRRGVTRVELMLALVHRAARAYRDAAGPGSPPPDDAARRLPHTLRAICETAEHHLALLAGLSSVPASWFHDDEPRGRATRLDYTERWSVCCATAPATAPPPGRRPPVAPPRRCSTRWA